MPHFQRGYVCAGMQKPERFEVCSWTNENFSSQGAAAHLGKAVGWSLVFAFSAGGGVRLAGASGVAGLKGALESTENNYGNKSSLEENAV